jgi:hypothetical protein
MGQPEAVLIEFFLQIHRLSLLKMIFNKDFTGQTTLRQGNKGTRCVQSLI